MFVKQLKIMHANQVSLVAFTTEQKANLFKLDVYKAEHAKRLAESVPSKLSPYNYCDPKTMDIVVKTKSIDNVVRRIVGASADYARADVEQHVGVITLKLLKTGLPVIAGVQAFMHETGEVMIGAKVIVQDTGKRYMYALLNRLGQLQRQSPENTDYIGLISDRAIAQDGQYEMICTFIVTFDALKALEQEKFGFFVDITALKKFDYTLARMQAVKPTKEVLKSIESWVSEHNARMEKVLSTFYSKG